MRWVVVAALVFGCGFCAADEIDLETVRGTLDTAVDTYFEEIIELDKEITERIDKLIEMAGNRGDLDEVEELQRQRKAYLITGFLPEGRIHLVTRRRAEFGINRAKSRLDQAYEEAVENLTKEGRYTDARRIKDERHGLEQKLKAAQPKLQPTNIINQAREWKVERGKPLVADGSEKVPAARDAPPAAVATESITNSIGIKLNKIPAGTFTMGENENAHEVILTQPFFLGVTEVTNAQWKTVMGNVPSQWKDDNLPVEQVSWEDAVSFCGKLSSLPAERAVGRVYRLPTEAEWEYSCRAGRSTTYSFGDDESLLGDFAWFFGNAGGQTHPVGQKRANAWGLHEMHGNIWEWCSDWHGDYPGGPVTNPRGPASGSHRVHRGGGWNSSARTCRSAFRGSRSSNRDHDLGFRLALSPSDSKQPEAGQ